jgi:hypothetical protein
MARRRVGSRLAMSVPTVEKVNDGEQDEGSRKRERSTVDDDREQALESDELNKAIKERVRHTPPYAIVRTICLEAAMTRLRLSKNKK